MRHPTLRRALLCLLAAAPAAAQPAFTDVTATHLPPAAAVSQNSMDVEAADLDGDGDLDLVVAGEFEPNKLLLNDGAGRFTDGSAGFPALPPAEVPGPLPPAHDTEDIAIADFDGDGVLDVVFVSEDDVTHGRSAVHEYYRGRGDATFERVYGQLPDTEANAVAVADVTGDGAPDLALGGAGQDRLLVNDGAGGFTDETAERLPVEALTNQDLEFVDVDGDGDLDLVLGNEGGHAIWINDGTGHFTDETAARLPNPGNVEARKVTPVDLDGDGDLDLYFAHVGWQGRSPQDAFYRNDGTGHFEDAFLEHFEPESATTTDAKFGDLDGDGDLDLVRVTAGRQEVLLQGDDGRFVDATDAVLPAPIQALGVGVELVDVDADGRPDLYFALLRGPQQDPNGYDRLLLNATITGHALPPGAASPALGAPYPNPFTSRLTVPFELSEAGPVRLDVVDAVGRPVAALARGAHAAGPHAATLDAAALAAGVYWVRLRGHGADVARAAVRAGR